MSDCKPELIRQLQLLANDHKTRNDTFRVRAYNKVLQSLKDSNAVGAIKTEKDLDNVPGLSKTGSIRQRMVTIIKNFSAASSKATSASTSLSPASTNKRKRSDSVDSNSIKQANSQQGNSSSAGAGSSQKINSQDLDLPEVKKIKESKESQILQQLQKIHGFGGVRAQQLVNSYKVRSLADLLKLPDNVLTRTEKIGVEYYDDINADIPRQETEQHVVFLKKQVEKLSAVLKKDSTSTNSKSSQIILNDLQFSCEVTGSFRRGEKKNGDIDLVLTMKNHKTTLEPKKVFQGFLALLAETGYLTETLASSVELENYGNSSYSPAGKNNNKGSIKIKAGRSSTSSSSSLNNKPSSTSSTPSLTFSPSSRLHGAAIQKVNSDSSTSSNNWSLKWMGLAKLFLHDNDKLNKHRRLDILFVPSEIYPFTLVHFTGNALFNIDLRNHALNCGYSLSEHGFRYVKKESSASQAALNKKTPSNQYSNQFVSELDISKKLNKKKFETEADVFRFLGLKYINPGDRKHGVLGKHRL